MLYEVITRSQNFHHRFRSQTILAVFVNQVLIDFPGRGIVLADSVDFPFPHQGLGSGRPIRIFGEILVIEHQGVSVEFFLKFLFSRQKNPFPGTKTGIFIRLKRRAGSQTVQDNDNQNIIF